MSTVCVTGASGYIASWLVKFLLQRGHTVRASVRDPDNERKTAHLRSLDGAKERLHLLKADLLEEGSFDSLVDGCEGVFHTASPYIDSFTDPQVELIDPALKGTLNVLESCSRTPSVKRVVLTSSMAAVAFDGRPQTPEVVVDETWWSNPDFCRENKLWYILSKTLAEDAAWKFVKEKGIDMVVINPAMVIGPLLQPTLNTSATKILGLITGGETYPNSAFGWVHVKDIANAHVLAFENPSANGRYCIVEKVAHYSDIVKILSELYPDLQLPKKDLDLMIEAEMVAVISPDEPILSFADLTDRIAEILFADFVALPNRMVEIVLCQFSMDQRVKKRFIKIVFSHIWSMRSPMLAMVITVCADEKPFIAMYNVSKERAKSLGLEFTPLEESIKDTVESLKEKNFFKPPITQSESHS